MTDTPTDPVTPAHPVDETREHWAARLRTVLAELRAIREGLRDDGIDDPDGEGWARIGLARELVETALMTLALRRPEGPTVPSEPSPAGSAWLADLWGAMADPLDRPERRRAVADGWHALAAGDRLSVIESLTEAERAWLRAATDEKLGLDGDDAEGMDDTEVVDPADERETLLDDLSPRLYDALDAGLSGLSTPEIHALSTHPDSLSALVLLAGLAGRAEPMGDPEGDDISELQRLAHDAALEATDSEAYADAWWTAPNGRLAGRPPAEVATEGPEGRARVRAAIQALANAGGMP